MNKKYRIILSLILAVSLCTACGKTVSKTEPESANNNVELIEHEDVDQSESEQLVTVVDTWEFEKVMNQSAETVAPNIDISDCDTFTQIIDKKLEDGMGWINEDFGDTNVLMVCSGTYDNLDGNMAGIDAVFYVYKDGIPGKLGKVCSGGTAYPLAKNDIYLYTASNHWICKNIVTEDGIQIMEGAAIEYDANGKAVYYYTSQENEVMNELSSMEAEELMNNLYAEMENAEIINFDTIQR